MKLFTTYSRSHEQLHDEWFLASMQDDYEVESYRNDVVGSGSFLSSDWTEAILFKAHTIIDAIRRHWNEVFIYSDVDICFYASTRRLILQAMGDRDIVLQADDPTGNYCSGFFAMRANEQMLALWERVVQAIPLQQRDQLAFNTIIRIMPELRCGYLPLRFFGTGTFTGQHWQPGVPFYIPLQPVMFHANWIVGVDTKLLALQQADRIIRPGLPSILLNNFRYWKVHGLQSYRAVKAAASMPE
jgi:hypothetical protein